jgi:hypothetical protein
VDLSQAPQLATRVCADPWAGGMHAQVRLGLALQAATAAALGVLQPHISTDDGQQRADPSSAITPPPPLKVDAAQKAAILDTAAQLFLHLCRIGVNSHAITAVLASGDSQAVRPSSSSSTGEGGLVQCVEVETLAQQRLAVAVYRAASLCNHSCAPSAKLGAFVGRTLSLIR